MIFSSVSKLSNIFGHEDAFKHFSKVGLATLPALSGSGDSWWKGREFSEPFQLSGGSCRSETQQKLESRLLRRREGDKD
jgi:hypothetical protein